jgi:hypothetical protein
MLRRSRTAAIAVAASIALAPTARASISTEAQPIVERYVAATGGRSALDAEHALHTRGRLNTLSLRGSFERWVQRPDRLLEHLSLGTMRIQQGFDGTTGWRMDLTGKKATIVGGKELERLQSDAYFANEMWARDGQGGGKVMRGTSGFRNGEDYCSLDVTPPVGPPRKLWFSVKTGLITREITRMDNSESDSWYTEYRTVAGRKRAMGQSAFDPNLHITFDPHQDEDTEQAFIDSVWVNQSVDSTRFAPPAMGREAVAWAKTPGVAVMPFRYGGSHVWVRGSINGGPPVDFILDTGASVSVLDREYAEMIGLKHEGAAGVQGMGGEGSVTFSRVGSFRVGGVGDGVTLKDMRVALIDLAGTDEPLVWRRISGLIGYDILSHFVVEIDYDRRLVTFRESKGFEYKGKGQPLDMTLTFGVPVVRVKLDDQCEGDFLVDVGNAVGVLLHGSLVRRCQMFDMARGRKQLEIYSGGVGAYFVSWITRINKLTLGPFEVPKPIVGMSLGTRGMVGSNDFAGNIGSTLLEQFVCTFDYERHKLYLEPGKTYGTAGHFSRAGSMFLRYPHRVVVAGILRGSAAEEAGLKPEDEVTMINNKPVLTFTAEDIDRLFVDGEPGTVHTLTILREGKSKTLKMTLKDAL